MPAAFNGKLCGMGQLEPKSIPEFSTCIGGWGQWTERVLPRLIGDNRRPRYNNVHGSTMTDIWVLQRTRGRSITYNCPNR
jgi:hypothetical protein